MPGAIRHPLYARFYARLARAEDRAGVAEHRRDLVAGRRVRRALDATVWPPLMGGCHLTRDTVAAIATAGFEIRELRRFRFGATPAAPHTLGAATAP